MKYFVIALFSLILLLQPNTVTISQEVEDERITEIRANWFIKQREYPYDSIPQFSIQNALQQRQSLLQNNSGQYAVSTPWTSIGPAPYYQYTTQPHDGRISFIKFYPYVIADPHPERVFLVTHNGGVWKSVNAQSSPDQVTFSPITDELITQSGGSLAIDPSNPNVMYLGTGGNMYGFRYNYYGMGVFKTTNGGTNWTGPYHTGLPDMTIIARIVVLT